MKQLPRLQSIITMTNEMKTILKTKDR